MLGGKQQAIDYDGKSFDADIRDLPLPEGAKKLIVSLRQFGQVREGVVDVSPSLEEIQQVLGVRSRRTVQSYLHSAETRARRYVTIRENPGGRYSFRIHRVPISQDAERFRTMRGNVRAAFDEGCNLESQGMQVTPARDAISTAQASPEKSPCMNHDLKRNISNDHDIHTRRGRFLGGWDRLISRDTLRDPREVEGLYRHACRRGWIQASDIQRLHFHRLAIYVRETADTPGASLTTLVTGKSWFGDDEHEDQARAAIRAVDGAAPRASPPAYAFEGDEADRKKREFAERYGAGGTEARR